MDIYGCHFEYAGVSSRIYDLIIANVNTTRNISLSGTTQSISIFNKKEKKKYHVGDSYQDSPLVFDLEVVTEKPLHQTEVHKIEKWLFYQRDYKKLFIDIADDIDHQTYSLIDGEEKRLYLNCRFINPEKLEYNGGIVGFKFTVECDTNMAYQEPFKKVFTGSEINDSMIVDVDTDIADFVYPKVIITTGSRGKEIQIVNHTDSSSRITSFIDVPPHSQIIMHGHTNFISGNYYEKFCHKNFIRLLDGENIISVEGDVSNISFEWQNMRYL